MINKKENLDELSQLSGENQIRKRYWTVPTLKFNGSKNEWALLVKNPDTKKFDAEVITEPLITILKIRRTLTAYEKLSDGTAIRWWTNEHDSWNDSLILFKKGKADLRATVVTQGGVEEIKESNSSLKLSFVLYCLYEDQIYRFLVKGKSLASFFEYLNDLESNKHIFENKIQLTSHEETNEGGLTYYVVNFETKETSDLKKVKEAMNTITTELEKQKVQTKTTQEDEEVKESTVTEEKSPNDIEDITY